MSVMSPPKFNEASIISSGPSTVHVYPCGHEGAKPGIDFHIGFTWEFLLQVLLRGILRFQQSRSDGAGQTWAPEYLCRLQTTYLQLSVPVCV